MAIIGNDVKRISYSAIYSELLRLVLIVSIIYQKIYKRYQNYIDLTNEQIKIRPKNTIKIVVLYVQSVTLK